MRINWDQFPGDEQQPISAPLRREPLSAGFHLGTVERVSIQEGWRKSEENPSGDCLSIWVDFIEGGDRKRIFVTVPCTSLNWIAAIAVACGVAPPKRGEDWDEQTLINARPWCETKQYLVEKGANAGETRAAVAQWVHPDKAPGRKTETVQDRRARGNPEEVLQTKTKRTAAKAAPAQQQPMDDIPF